MAGHSHWKQIKTRKASSDKERGRVFSKILNAISVAAREEPNPDFNPRLRAAILKGREAQVPRENIERAIRGARENSSGLAEIIMEAFGPGGAPILIGAVTDSRNRTINEVRQLLQEFGARWADPGSVRWLFDPPSENSPEWRAKFKKELGESDRGGLKKIVEAVQNQGDVQWVCINADL